MSDSPETLILNVDEAADGVRIDKFLSDTLTEYSRSFIQKIIKDELVLEGIHVEVAQRVIDYSAGSCYAMRGNLQKITSYIFLVTPPNVDISGDIPELVAGGIDLSSFKN